jgi:hypothetical protein
MAKQGYFVLAKNEYRWHLISHRQMEFSEALEFSKQQTQYPNQKIILADYYNLFDLFSENLDPREDLMDEVKNVE